MIHGAGYYSDECKVLGEFGTKYDISQPTKDRGINPVPRKDSIKNKKTKLLLTMWWMKSK